jgi:hypothetical protein
MDNSNANENNNKIPEDLKILQELLKNNEIEVIEVTSLVNPENNKRLTKFSETDFTANERVNWERAERLSDKLVAPIEFANVENLRQMLRFTSKRFGGFYIMFHPESSKCEEKECRSVTPIQRELLERKGINSAYPFTVNPDELNHYTETIVWSLTGLISSDTELYFVKPQANSGFCSESIALKLPDTVNGILQPLIKLAEIKHEIDTNALDKTVEETRFTPRFDIISQIQASATGLSVEELLKTKFTPISSSTRQILGIVHKRDLGHGITAIAPEGASLRIGGLNPVVPLPFGPARNWSDASSTHHLVDIEIGIESDEKEDVHVSFSQKLPCGHERAVELDGVLDTWTEYLMRLGDTTLLPNSLKGEVRVTLYCPEQEVLQNLKSENQSKEIVMRTITGEVADCELLVNKVSRKLFWSLTLNIPLGCEDSFHTEVNGGEKAFIANVNAFLPCSQDDIAIGDKITVTGLPVIEVIMQ